MKRNGNMRGRGFVPPARDNAGGPLMTEHLTIQNLERELDMLRRKREAIQQEQNRFAGNEFDRKRQFEHHAPPNHNFPNAFRDFWEPSPPKRFNEPPRGNHWRDAGPDFPGPFAPNRMVPEFNSPRFNQNIEIHRPPVPLFNQGPVALIPRPPAQPKPPHGFVPRFAKRPATGTRNDFNLTKLTKHRPQIPNKQHAYPVEGRGKLAQKATLTQEDRNAGPAANAAVMTLREDQIPTKQVTGRLELALGHIIKEIKENNKDNDTFANLTMNAGYKRTMKQAIRERLRSVMLNQPVGSVVDIVDKYRTKFPMETDREIIDLVINSGRQPLKVPVVESDDPEEFFKTNITRIVEKKVEEMFSNLMKMYCTSHRKSTLAYTKAARDANQLEKAFEMVHSSQSQSEKAMSAVKALSGKLITVEENNLLHMYYTELMESILEEKVLGVLPKCMKHCVKIFDLDHHYRAVKFMAIKRLRDGAKDKKAAAKNMKKNNEQEKNTATNKNDSLEESTKKDDAGPTMTPDDIKSKTQEIEDNEIVDIKDVETEDNKEDSKVALEEVKTPATPQPNKTEPVTSSETPITPATPSLKELPYYVKLIGRPHLPTRAVIYNFLNSYHPTSIKKHKSINNLLVVGFVNQEDYDKILSAHETVLGDITIIIKASEKIILGNPNESINETQGEGVGKEEGMKETGSISTENQTPADTGSETLPETAEFNSNDTKLEKIMEVDENGDSQEPEQADKDPKVNMKETGRSTPARATRASIVTPSTIRTRRASRLMQE